MDMSKLNKPKAYGSVVDMSKRNDFDKNNIYHNQLLSIHKLETSS